MSDVRMKICNKSSKMCYDDLCLRMHTCLLETLIVKECEHKNTHIKVISSIVTCETTVVVCDDCGKYLTEPKRDC